MSLPWAWGATAEEVAATPRGWAVRAVEVGAPAAVTWRWVCQLTQAPYSYDLVDNLGRRSPRTLTPGAAPLVVGDRFAGVFRVVHVEPGAHVRAERGRWVLTYDVVPYGTRSRLVGRLDCTPAGPLAAALAWGDLPMMRKQLRTLASLAASTTGPVGD